MTVETTVSRAQYNTNGTTGPWTVPFYFIENGDLSIIHTDADGNETELALDVGYSVTGAGDPTGTVTTTTAYPSGGYITVLRNVDPLQAVDFTDGDDFPANSVERGLDRLTQLIQQALELVGRALVFAPSDISGSTLPAASVRASKLLGFDSDGVLNLSAPASGSSADLALDLANTASIPKGDYLLGVKKTATGAVATTQHEVNERIIDAFDYFSVAQRANWLSGTASVDVAAAIQAAIDYAYTNVVSQTVFDDYGYHSRGGAIVQLPRGKGLLLSTLTLRPGVKLRGAGSGASCIYATHNGKIITVAQASKSGEYNQVGVGICELMVLGNKTGAAQVGIDLMRPVQLDISDVVVNSCGADGVILREVSNSLIKNLEIANCAGKGLRVMNGDTALPSNANTFLNIRVLYNDGDGISLEGCNGNLFIGGSSERNGYASSGVGHYNVVVTTAAYVPNIFQSFWTEGPCKAHVYINSPSSSDTVCLTNWKHFGGGAASLPERALICDKGTAVINEANSSTTIYKTVAGSNAPFRLTKATGLITLRDSSGSSAVGLGWVEDETGARTGLYNNLRQSNFNVFFGPQILYNDNTQTDGLELRTDTLTTNPWAKFSAFDKAALFGDGTGAPDAGFYRSGANILTMLSGDSFQVNGTAGATLRFGNGTATGAVATTFGGNGPTGATAGNQIGWLRINVAGTDRYVPYW